MNDIDDSKLQTGIYNPLVNCKEQNTLFTGEFYYFGTQKLYIHRKPKDTYVFLKDYKQKITEISKRLYQIEFNWKWWKRYIRQEEKMNLKKIKNQVKLQNDKINKLILLQGEVERILLERIEKLDKEVYDLKNPPLKPKLQNPFD